MSFFGNGIELLGEFCVMSADSLRKMAVKDPATATSSTRALYLFHSKSEGCVHKSS